MQCVFVTVTKTLPLKIIFVKRFFVILLAAMVRATTKGQNRFGTFSHLSRVHAKGVVLCDRACFCLLDTFWAPSMKRSLLRTLSLPETLTGAF